MSRHVPPTLARAVLAVVAVALLCTGDAFASAMRPDSPNIAKDFSIVYALGQFHIFYIRHDTSVAADSTERDFGHAVSPDLVNWTQLPPVLPVRPDHWDNFQMWAPHVLAVGDSFYLFYTGVTADSAGHNRHQRIGLAVSADLENWERMDEPVFACDSVSWAACDPSDAELGFRDPFVMPDPAIPGNYLMFYSTNLGTLPGNMVAGLASSSGDLRHWVDLEPMMNTYLTSSYSHKIESPHVLIHGDYRYLFYTTGLTPPLHFQTSTDTLEIIASWSHPIQLHAELNTMNPIMARLSDFWFATEILSVSTEDYFCAVNTLSGAIEIRLIRWDAPPHFHLMDPASPTAGVAPSTPTAPALALTCPAALGRDGRWEFDAALPSAARARVQVHDVSGRTLATLVDGFLPSGSSRLQWDGRDDAGGRAPAGVYWASLAVQGEWRAAKFVVLR
jgi:hypothetical protein